MSAYTTALNAASARLRHANEVIRPKLIAAQSAAMAIADQESLEAAVAWAEVAGLTAAGDSMRTDALKYSEYADELRGEVDL